MDDLMKLLIFVCLLLWPTVSAAPLSKHNNGGLEHVVIVNKNHPTPPRVADVLSKLDLHPDHPAVKHVYNNTAFQGFAATMESSCLDKLAQMEGISLVEQSSQVSTTTITLPEVQTFSTRNSAPWGLERISLASDAGGNANNLNFTYGFGDEKLGANTDIYVIDTGVYTANQVFAGRAQLLWSFDNNMTIADGHGTHVAGIAGGDVLGVASNANIIGLKALTGDGSGSTSDVIKAIDLAINRHQERQKSDSKYTGAVISMSLASSEVVQGLNFAVDAATKAGVHAVVAAGNNANNPDACGISPASAGGSNGSAISVGAIDIQSQIASFSNFGPCVDLYAPGVDVISAWIGAPDRVASLSGTSMATPHVTGLVAYAMANETLAKDPALMKAFIRLEAVNVGKGVLVANNGVHHHIHGGKGGKSNRIDEQA